MALDSLIVYECPFPKVRVGSANDGGYIIADNQTYDAFLSCGIANDITFEKQFLSKHTNIECFAYDGTINSLPESVPRLNFIKKNINVDNTPSTTNLHDMIDKYSNIFLKMDIETFEFRWLLTLTEEKLKKFKQIVIEFHFPFNEPGFTHLDIPTAVESKLETLNKLAKTHWLIHLHGNNCCGTTQFNNITVPNVFECTYIRKDLIDAPNYNTTPIPHPLDKPNVNNSDICLKGYPFTH